MESLQKAIGLTVGNVETISCVFCQASIHFAGLPPLRYADHLFKEHNILFDQEAVIDRTLAGQVPGYKPVNPDNEGRAKARPTVDAWVQTDPDPSPIEEAQASPAANSVISPCSSRYHHSLAPHSLLKKSGFAPRINASIPIVEAPWLRSTLRGPRISHVATIQELEPGSSPTKGWVKSEPSTLFEPVVSLKVGSPPNPGQEATHVEIAASVAWYSGCEYQCQICEEMFYNTEYLRKHIQSLHCSAAEYLDKYAMLETKTVMYRCELCGEEIKRNFAAIRNHLDQAHGVSVDQYGLRYGLLNHDVKRQVRVERLRQASETLKVGADLNESAVQTRKRTYSEVSLETDDLNPTGWYHGSEFQCGVCEQVFFEAFHLASHALSAHELSSMAYLERFKALETKSVQFKCSLCQSELPHQRSQIWQHLDTVHRVTMQEYEDIFHLGHRQLQLRLTQLSPALINRYGVLLKDESLRFKSLEDFAQDRIRYSCALCQFEVPQGEAFWAHTTAEHELPQASYTDRHGDPVRMSRTIDCPICFVSLPHQVEMISKHASEAHRIGLSDLYHRYFKSTSGEGEPESEKVIAPEPAKPRNQLEDVSADVGFKRWSNACEFQCQICQVTTSKTESQLKHHLRTKHTMSPSVYVAKYHSFITRKVYVRCQLCLEDVLQRQLTLRRHMSRHKMVLDDYFQFCIVKTKKDRSRSLEENYKSWTSRKSLICHICEMAFLDETRLVRHIKNHHVLSVADYESTYGAMAKKLRHHVCKICDKKLVHRSGALQTHMKSHKTTLGRYFEARIEDKPQEDPEEDSLNHSETYTGDDVELKSWLAKSQFECQMCFQDLEARPKMRAHVEDHHRMTTDQYRRLFGSLMSKLKTHDCHICQESVSHEEACLNAHLSSDHQVGMEEYFLEYVQPFLEDMADLEKCPEAEDVRQFQSEAQIWANKCRYDCRVCNGLFNTKVRLIMHIRAEHNLTAEQYINLHQKLASDARKILCELCGAAVLWTSKSISLHMYKKHPGMSLDQYFIQYAATAQEAPPEPIPKLIPKLVVRSRPPTRTKTVPTVTNPTTIAPAAVPTVLVAKSRGDRKQILALDWKNQCRFDCQICRAPFKVYSKLLVHLRSKHQMDSKTYLARFKKTVTQHVYHLCVLCKKRIPQRQDCLIHHFRGRHQMKTTDYYETYVARKRPPSAIRAPSAKKAKLSAFSRWIQEGSGTKHVCLLCGSSIEMEVVVLDRHLMAAHGLTSGQYYGKYLGNGNDDTVLETTSGAVTKWMNQCTFKCLASPESCAFIIKDRNKFVFHLQSDHGLEPEHYTNMFCSLESECKYHTCQICCAVVLHDGFSLKTHLRTHGTTISAYHAKSMRGVGRKVNDEDAFVDVESHMSPNPGGLTSTLRNIAQDATGSGDKSWMNRCLFRCALCGHEDSSKLAFTSHLHTDHKMNFQQYSTAYGNPMVHKETFQCAICAISLICHDQAITNHLTMVHSLTTDQYYHNHVAQSTSKASSGSSSTMKLKHIVEGCLFGCRYCPASLSTTKDLATHENFHHEKGDQPLPKGQGGKTVLRTHDCLICGREVRMTKKSMSNHLYIHKITCGQYEAKYRNELVAEAEALEGSLMETASPSPVAEPVEHADVTLSPLEILPPDSVKTEIVDFYH